MHSGCWKLFNNYIWGLNSYSNTYELNHISPVDAANSGSYRKPKVKWGWTFQSFFSFHFGTPSTFPAAASLHKISQSLVCTYKKHTAHLRLCCVWTVVSSFSWMSLWACLLLRRLLCDMPVISFTEWCVVTRVFLLLMQAAKKINDYFCEKGHWMHKYSRWNIISSHL